MVVKVKKTLKRLDKLKILINLKNTFYLERKIQDTMIEFYLIKRNLIVSHFILFESVPWK